MCDATSSPPPTKPTRSDRLLLLVRKLIDYGRQLGTALLERTADLAAVTCDFGTKDIALILRRIACGLQRANALEARIIESGARLDAAPGRATATARRTPRAEAAGPRRVWARGQRYGDQDRPNVSVPVPSIA